MRVQVTDEGFVSQQFSVIYCDGGNLFFERVDQDVKGSVFTCIRDKSIDPQVDTQRILVSSWLVTLQDADFITLYELRYTSPSRAVATAAVVVHVYFPGYNVTYSISFVVTRCAAHNYTVTSS